MMSQASLDSQLPQRSQDSQLRWRLSQLNRSHNEPEMLAGSLLTSAIATRSSMSDVSELSADGARSVASAPALIQCQRCFLSNTYFKVSYGSLVTAAMLKPGLILQGPAGLWLEIDRVAKHRPQDTDVIQIEFADDFFPFKCTADHGLLVIDEQGEKHTARAADVKSMWQQDRQVCLSDGSGARAIVSVMSEVEHVEVVEVFFTHPDAIVLAWMLPKNRPHRGPRQADEHGAVLAFGSHPQRDSALPFAESVSAASI